jgi:transitional endoplasmic reticulum ATPase
MSEELSPSQQAAVETVVRKLEAGPIVTVCGGGGVGKTTVLRALHARLGGVLLTMKEYVDALRSRHPLAMEETVEQLIMTALREHDVVFVDDFQLLSDVVSGCGAYPRPGFLDAAVTVFTTYAVEAGKKLVVATDSPWGSEALRRRAFRASISGLTVPDYQFLCGKLLGPEVGARLDYSKIHRFAAHLDGYDIRKACAWLGSGSDLDTDRFIDYLQSQGLNSNVDLEEVQQVDLADLKGCDDVIQSLVANIVVPLERDDLAIELGLKPKRGVLLAGPPGTGKTTVGRALAHRLRGKFFLVDGTVISGSSNFYGQIHQIFEAAKENAPAVIFIDDSDVIFESGEELGLYRYLLTMLDGLESESSGRVCVMLTAMDVANIPPALLRSGRIELWLEMRLPDADARRSILEQRLHGLAASMGQPDLNPVISATDGFTGADLKRLVEDAKNLYAYDRAQEVPRKESTAYFLQAIETVIQNRDRYSDAAARARPQRAGHQSSFGPFPGLDGVSS